MLDAAKEPTIVLGRVHPGVDVRDLRFVDSKSDPRVQVADILGGVGQEVARQAMRGVFDDDLQLAVPPLSTDRALAISSVSKQAIGRLTQRATVVGSTFESVRPGHRSLRPRASQRHGDIHLLAKGG